MIEPISSGPHPVAKREAEYAESDRKLIRDFAGATQRLYRFENDFGASVIQGPFSYALEMHPDGFELAVMDFEHDPGGALCYWTEICDDVMFVESEESLQIVLQSIKDLDRTVAKVLARLRG